MAFPGMRWDQSETEGNWTVRATGSDLKVETVSEVPGFWDSPWMVRTWFLESATSPKTTSGCFPQTPTGRAAGCVEQSGVHQILSAFAVARLTVQHQLKHLQTLKWMFSQRLALETQSHLSLEHASPSMMPLAPAPSVPSEVKVLPVPKIDFPCHDTCRRSSLCGIRCAKAVI